MFFLLFLLIWKDISLLPTVTPTLNYFNYLVI